MRILGFILAASIILAALRVAVVGLYLILLLSLIVSAISKPRETVALLAFVAFMTLLGTHPLATLGAIVALCAIGAIAKHFERR